jgi:hypothetical protein
MEAVCSPKCRVELELHCTKSQKTSLISIIVLEKVAASVQKTEINDRGDPITNEIFHSMQVV